MGETTKVDGKKPKVGAKALFKREVIDVLGGEGTVGRVARRGFGYLLGRALSVEAQLTSVGKRTQTLEGKVDGLETSVTELKTATSEIAGIGLKATNAKEAAETATKDVAGIKKEREADAATDKRRDERLGELETGWSALRKKVEELATAVGEVSVDKVKAMVEAAVTAAVGKIHIPTAAPVVVSAPAGVNEDFVEERLQRLKTALEDKIGELGGRVDTVEDDAGEAIMFVRACGPVLERGVIPVRVSEALETTDFSEVLAIWYPDEIRGALQAISEDGESTVKFAAKEALENPKSLLATKFREAVVKWIATQVDEPEFTGMCVRAGDGLGSPEAFIAALDEFAAQAGEAGDAARATKAKIDEFARGS
jgi:hypothetical protein